MEVAYEQKKYFCYVFLRELVGFTNTKQGRRLEFQCNGVAAGGVEFRIFYHVQQLPLLTMLTESLQFVQLCTT